MELSKKKNKVIPLRPEPDDSPFLPRLQETRWGRGRNSVCGEGGQQGEQLPKSSLCFPKTLAKIRQLEAPSDIPLRQDKLPYKKRGRFGGPKPSPTVKEIRPSLTETNVSAV